MVAIIGFFDFIKIYIAQGWQFHTHLHIIMGVPDMNNQKRKICIKIKQSLPSWLPDY